VAAIIGIPGRLRLESVAAFARNPWPTSSEYAVSPQIIALRPNIPEEYCEKKAQTKPDEDRGPTLRHDDAGQFLTRKRLAERLSYRLAAKVAAGIGSPWELPPRAGLRFMVAHTSVIRCLTGPQRSCRRWGPFTIRGSPFWSTVHTGALGPLSLTGEGIALQLGAAGFASSTRPQAPGAVRILARPNVPIPPLDRLKCPGDAWRQASLLRAGVSQLRLGWYRRSQGPQRRLRAYVPL
jgi:hypothetical protein